MGLQEFIRTYKNKLRITSSKKEEKPKENKTNLIKPLDISLQLPSSSISEKYRQFPFSTRQNAITDEYEVSRESLGVGISGKVLTCWHRQTKRKCALKILKDSDKARREVILHKRACENCENIVQVLDIYENVYASNRCLLIVMECMDGGELFNRIRDRQDKPFTEREAGNIITMITNAVIHLHHMDIAHRDLKPENLLFTNKSDNAVLKLTDFGFAKEGNNEQLPLNTPCYTPYYVAPEILSNNKYDKACDIWSLGVIMYILLCGYPPFFSTHGGAISAGMRTKIKAGEYQFPKAEWGNVSQEAKSIIQQMLTVDPAVRVTIDWVRRQPWFHSTVPETPIDIRPFFDLENYEQMKVESELNLIDLDLLNYYSCIVAAANHAQRRADDEEIIGQIAPHKSRIAQRAAKRQCQTNVETVQPSLSNISE